MKDFLACLFRRKRIFLAFFAGMVAFPMFLAYVLPAKYEASATLLLEPGRYKKPFLPTERDSRTSLVQVSMEDVGSEVELILSYPVLAEVVDKNRLDADDPPDFRDFGKWAGYWTIAGINKFFVITGLKPAVPAREDAIKRLQTKVDVDFVKRTNIINVKWRGSSPQLARDVVNTLVDAYLRHHVRVHGNAFALQAMKKEFDESRQKLTTLENELSTFEERKSIGNVETQHASILAKLTESENRYMLLRTIEDKGITTSELSRLDSDPAFSGLWTRLNDLELKRMDLLSHYGPSERRVTTMEQEIERLKDLIRERFARNLTSAKEQVDLYRKNLRQLEDAKLQIERKQRELDGMQQLFALNREKYNEVQISSAMDDAAIGSVRVVEYAELQTGPAFPKRFLILIVSLFLGVVGGVAVAVSFDRLSNRVVSVSDIEEAAGAPVLASIKEYVPANGNRPAVFDGAAYDLIPVREALLNGSATPRSVLLVSPSHEAGTSYLVDHFAQSSSGMGRRVVVVSFRYAEGGEGEGSTVERLLQSPAAAQNAVQSERGFSRLVVALPREESPSSGAQVKSLLERLKADGYGLILVEAPAYRGDMFYLQIVPHVDQVVLVAGYDVTNRFSLARMGELVRRHHGQVAGCILNRRRDVIPPAIYERLF